MVFLHHHMIDGIIRIYNFLLYVQAVTLIFISGRGLAISSAKQGKSDSIFIVVSKMQSNEAILFFL